MNQKNGISLIYRLIQRVRQIWIWLIILFLVGLVWYGFIIQVVMHNPFGTRPAPDIVLILFWLIFGIGFPLLLPFISLIIEVHDDGIYTLTLHKSLAQKRYARSISGHKETLVPFQDLTVY